MGKFIEMYPEYLNQLKGFAKSGNRWMRRASAVSLIIPVKKGKFLGDILEKLWKNNDIRFKRFLHTGSEVNGSRVTKRDRNFLGNIWKGRC